MVVVPVLAALLSACAPDHVDPPQGSRRVTISTSYGERLDAVELGRGSEVVVLSHGANGTKEGFYPLVEALARAGWRAVAYDARGVGESTGRRGDRRDVDPRAVVDYVRTSGGGAVVLVGASLGASLSLSMADELDADAVVSPSAPASTFGALEAVRALDGAVPVFVAAAVEDDPFVADARALANASRVEPVIVSGRGHGTGMFDDHPDLVDEIVTFLQQVGSARGGLGASSRWRAGEDSNLRPAA